MSAVALRALQLLLCFILLIIILVFILLPFRGGRNAPHDQMPRVQDCSTRRRCARSHASPRMLASRARGMCFFRPAPSAQREQPQALAIAAGHKTWCCSRVASPSRRCHLWRTILPSWLRGKARLWRLYTPALPTTASARSMRRGDNAKRRDMMLGPGSEVGALPERQELRACRASEVLKPLRLELPILRPLCGADVSGNADVSRAIGDSRAVARHQFRRPNENGANDFGRQGKCPSTMGL